MRSPVQIWLSAPRRTTSIPDVVFFALYAKRLLRNLCVGCPLRTPRERPTAFRRLCLLSSPLNAPQGAVLFCVIRKTVAAQPLRGCGLRSTHSSASVWFVSLGHHLHGRTWDVVFFASYAKRLQRNLCAGCPLRTPRERPLAFRPIVVCKTMTVLFQNRYASNAYAFCHCFASSTHAS